MKNSESIARRGSRIVWLLLAGFLLAGSPLLAQKRVHLKQADKLRGGRLGDERFDRLLGNVIMTQNKTTIYCDSAYFFKKRNYVEAFGRVRILEGDSVTITGRKLEYDGNTKLARLRNNVVFTKLATATLYTEYLDFDRNRNLAYYKTGGRLVDSVNTLTSVRGYYNVSNNLASFKKNVDVKNPDYTMTADSLQYNSRSKTIYFVSPTNVVRSDSSTIVYESGFYETTTKRSDLKLGQAETQDYTLDAEDYKLDDFHKRYLFRRNVVMTYKKESLIIYGQAADYYRTKGIAKVYNNAYLAKVADNGDTLFMSADTLVSIDSPDPAKKRLLAYKNVKIYKRDMQGVADSVEYRAIDSTIYFYKKPVLWSEGNQMTADSIRAVMKNNTIDRIHMVANSFVISRDTLVNYNQIKGRLMTTYFRDQKISHVYVEGNGESLYFLLDEKTNLSSGMNKIICSNIMIRFKQGKVNNLTFYKKPEASVIPPHELKIEDTKLKGFEWRGKEKPAREDVVKPQVPSISSNKAASVHKKELVTPRAGDTTTITDKKTVGGGMVKPLPESSIDKKGLVRPRAKSDTTAITEDRKRL
ncbi:Organic solvent tolerance protein OstA [Fulvivirgaceae bacterium PWU5]|uniref:Organic solvent tolerance protein OstA n=1 Tax=Dawidia cretensis TaxID=2782350 RepID=A0AAP2GNX1_9BACT|nr:OstA-like protein [Dawidia cretensis]MBT1707669.1 Organic solvent tolerance protein OstA [Dawidia cretensis]